MRKWIALDVAERYVDALRVLADVVRDPAEAETTTRDVDDDSSSPSPASMPSTTS